MQDETTRQIFVRIDAIAAKLGVAAQEIWRIYLAQAKITLLIDLLTELLLILIFIGGVVGSVKLWKFAVASDEYDEDWWMGASVASLFTLLLLIPILCVIPEIITTAMNPSFWALQEILTQLK